MVYNFVLVSAIEQSESHIDIDTDMKVKVKSLSHVCLFVTPWTVAPLSMGFSRQEDLPDPGIEPSFPAL